MELIQFLQSFSSDILNIIMLIITSFGSAYFPICIICIIYWCYNKDVGFKLAIIMACSGVLNSIVKNLVQSPRPIGVDGIKSIGEFSANGYSFPSGHTQNITVFSTSLAIFMRSKMVLFISIIFIFLVGLSRLYLGLHWPIDILGGIILAIIVSIVLNEVLIKLDSFKTNIFIGSLILIFFLGILLVGNNFMGEDYYKTMGIFVGVFLGHLFEYRYVNFSPEASNVDNIMKIILGISTTALLYIVLSYIFKIFSMPLFYMVKYLILGFWMFGVVPLIFKLSNLYYKEAYEITNIKYRK